MIQKFRACKSLSRRTGVSTGQRGWQANSSGRTRECCPHGRGDEWVGMADGASALSSIVRYTWWPVLLRRGNCCEMLTYIWQCRTFNTRLTRAQPFRWFARYKSTMTGIPADQACSSGHAFRIGVSSHVVENISTPLRMEDEDDLIRY
ncbi:hypothetical protein SK128_018725 [Halocaridina rubra]|uniref:Uncharacterized protein n=1 Tax=Halocaridina rubra TaxID=373956 RepID=A0AAN8WZL1_HALRR